MGFFRQFDEFDPLTGTPPHYPLSHLPTIVKRARALLKGRTRDEIVSAAHTADFFVEEYFTGEKDNYIQRVLETGGWELGYLPYEARNEAGIRELLDNWPSEADESPPDIPTSENASEVDALKECIGDYVLDDDADFPKGREYEYFAVLALWLVVDAMHWLKSDAAVQVSLVGEAALGAMDAVCYAEQLRAIETRNEELTNLRIQLHQAVQATEELAEEKANRKISVNARKAAIERNTENRAMKEQVFAWCAAHFQDYPSMDAAAEAVAGKLVPVAFRTARSWIGEYRKKGRSARRL